MVEQLSERQLQLLKEALSELKHTGLRSRYPIKFYTHQRVKEVKEAIEHIEKVEKIFAKLRGGNRETSLMGLWNIEDELQGVERDFERMRSVYSGDPAYREKMKTWLEVTDLHDVLARLSEVKKRLNHFYEMRGVEPPQPTAAEQLLHAAEPPPIDDSPPAKKLLEQDKFNRRQFLKRAAYIGGGAIATGGALGTVLNMASSPDKPKTQPTKTPTATPTHTPTPIELESGIYIQIGAFSDLESARLKIEEIEKLNQIKEAPLIIYKSNDENAPFKLFYKRLFDDVKVARSSAETVKKSMSIKKVGIVEVIAATRSTKWLKRYADKIQVDDIVAQHDVMKEHKRVVGKPEFWKMLNDAVKRYPTPKGEIIDPLFVWSMMYIESYYDPKAISRAKAKGLMQLMPKTWHEFHGKSKLYPHKMITKSYVKEIAKKDKTKAKKLKKKIGLPQGDPTVNPIATDGHKCEIFDPFQNIDAGINKLRTLHIIFPPGTVQRRKKILWSYNTGEGRVMKATDSKTGIVNESKLYKETQNYDDRHEKIDQVFRNNIKVGALFPGQ